MLRTVIVAAAALVLAGGPMPGKAGPQAIPLECRLADGPWRACTMLVDQVGVHWWLVLGSRRYEFSHDGKGSIRLRDGGPWRPVDSRWAPDNSLCWDGLCARGEIPLD